MWFTSHLLHITAMMLLDVHLFAMTTKLHHGARSPHVGTDVPNRWSGHTDVVHSIAIKLGHNNNAKCRRLLSANYNFLIRVDKQQQANCTCIWTASTANHSSIMPIANKCTVGQQYKCSSCFFPKETNCLLLKTPSCLKFTALH